nr:RNA polymerase beta' subunit [Ipomoea batatas]
MNWSSDVLYKTGTTLILPDLMLVVPPNVLILYVGSSIGAHHVGRHPPTVLRRLATLAAARGLSESKVKKTLEEKEAPMAEWSKMIQLLSNRLRKIPHFVYRKNEDPWGLGLLADNGLDWTNINPYSKSLSILPSSNCSRMDSVNGAKYHNVIQESIQEDPLIPIRNSLGPLGTSLPIAKRLI